MTARLVEIWIYPVKSLDGVSAPEARVVERGALEYDRRFAMVSPDGSFVNGKRNARVHRVRSQFDFAGGRLRVSLGNDTAEFDLSRQRAEAAEWLSRAVGTELRIDEHAAGGFPDDVEASGPTLISRGSLQEIATWFPGESAETMRARLRPNLVIDGVEAFGEDRLFSASGEPVRFRIGEVTLEGVNPCQRCVVPSRDPVDAAVLTGFQQRFAQMREATLPAWSPRNRFNHFYRVSLNTRIPETGGVLRRADVVELPQAKTGG